jgi:hypothetical protein
MGVPSRVAFQVTDENGLGMDATLSFPSLRSYSVQAKKSEQGMGTFEYTPDGKKFEVEIVRGLKRYHFLLPDVQKTGYTLRVDALDSTVRIRVGRSAGTSISSVGLSVYCRDRCSIFRILRSGNGTQELSIPLDSLSGGVNRVTLFGDNGTVYAERLFFVYPTNIPALSITGLKDGYTPNERIELGFRTIPGSSFSVSVRDRSGELISYRSNILNFELFQQLLSRHLLLEYPSTYDWETRHQFVRSFFRNQNTGQSFRYIERAGVYSLDQTPLDDIHKIVLYDNKRKFSYKWDHGTYSTYLTDLFFVYNPPTTFLDSQPSPNIRYTQMEGYTMPEAFTAGLAKPVPGLDDYRRTLYWNPEM